MGSFEVRFLEAALSDLEEITIYIATENKEAAKELHALIITRAKELSTLPYRGPKIPDEKISAMGFRYLSI